MTRWLRSLGALAWLLAADACAGQECDFHSQCGTGFYCSFGRCRQDCREDFDCEVEAVCSEIGQCVPGSRPDAGARDGGPTGPDGGGTDGGPRSDGGEDAGPPAVDGGHDAGPPMLGRYLDRCSVASDCESGECVDDVGGTRMCTRACAGHSQCAAEHVCASGLCRPDDTGQTCSGASGCALGLCVGNPSTGSGECTRTCSSASDCPAGYACSDAGGTFVCVNIERSCATCSTGLCLGAQGCTSTCRTAADCPPTLPGLAYSCSSGQCLPSGDVAGADALGAPCRMSGGLNLCRSAACLTDDAGTERCTQRCTAQGGCGPASGCVPVDAGGSIVLVCQPAGSGALLQSCTVDAQCRSSLCQSGFCTRMCTSDGLCPSGLTCSPRVGSAGTSVCQ